MSDLPAPYADGPEAWPPELSLATEELRASGPLAALYAQIELLAGEFDRPPLLRLRHFDLRRWERAPALAAIEPAVCQVVESNSTRSLPALTHQSARLAALGGKLEPAATLFRRAAEALPAGPAKVVALQNLLLVLLEGHRESEALEALAELAALAPRAAPLPVERYAVQAILGTGTFATVYRCVDTSSGQTVVVKALEPQPMTQPFPPLFQEPAVLLGLAHPSVVRCLAHGYVDPDRQAGPYCVLEFFDGINLHEYIRRYGPLSWQQLRHVLCEALQTLAALHARGIVHADIKPGNLLVRCDHEGWQIKLIDFGIAVRTGEAEAQLRPHERRPATPGFSAPEQVGQIAVDRLTPAADIYALARTACYCLFGRIEASLSELNDYPSALATVIRTGLLERPQQRPTADELLAIIRQPMDARPAAADEHATVGTAMPAEPGPASGIGTHAAGPGTNSRAPRTDIAAPPPPPGARATAAPPQYGPAPATGRGQLPGAAMPGQASRPGSGPSASGPLTKRPPEAPSTPAQSPVPAAASAVARGASLVTSALGAIGQTLGSLFKGGSNGAPAGNHHPAASDLVDCTLFAPAWIEPGSTALVQVAVHLQEAATEVALLAREFDGSAQRRGVKRLETEIARGSRLLFQLMVPGLTVDESEQSAVWRGQTEMLQFALTAPLAIPRQSVVGTLTVSVGGIPCGRIKFTLGVQSTQTGTQPAPQQHRMGRYRKVFVSYCSDDRREVLKRVQMLRQMQVEVFQDVLSLEPGQRWQRELYRRIDDSDLFLLFWSSAAKASEWVGKEVRYALDRQQKHPSELPDIIPVILEGPPIPPPPPELAHLHFNDQILTYLRQGTV